MFIILTMLVAAQTNFNPFVAKKGLILPVFQVRIN